MYDAYKNLSACVQPRVFRFPDAACFSLKFSIKIRAITTSWKISTFFQKTCIFVLSGPVHPEEPAHSWCAWSNSSISKAACPSRTASASRLLTNLDTELKNQYRVTRSSDITLGQAPYQSLERPDRTFSTQPIALAWEKNTPDFSSECGLASEQGTPFQGRPS